MRTDVLAVLKQYKHEIIEDYDLFDRPEIADWWYYLDDVAINVHDYEETGDIRINLYNWFDECGVVDMVASYKLTYEEFKSL